MAALALNAASYMARRRGDHAVGARLTAASALPLTLGGFLGAHMAYARGVGVSRTAFDEPLADWTRLDRPALLDEGWSETAARGLPLLARLRDGDGMQVVAARCTHCGGELRADEGGSCVRCARDGSAFGVHDGAVVEGPASTPIPVYEARTAATGGIEIRSPGPVS